MERKEKESMRFSAESLISRFMDRTEGLAEDEKNLIKDLIHTFGKNKDGEETLEIKNTDKETIHFLNADNKHLHVTPTLVYHNMYDDIGVYGEDGNYNQDDFDDVRFYLHVLALMFNSIFFDR